MNDNNLLFAFLITLFAGLATGIGSAIALFAKTTSRRFLSFALGLSAGVMIYISFVEILPNANISLAYAFPVKQAQLFTSLCFFGGIGLIALIDKLVPSIENPHEIRSVEDLGHKPNKPKLMRIGVMTAFAIGLHNFPEGIATFAAGLENPELGLAVAFAIAIHNIPEGIAVSVPIYHATGSRKKAFQLSFLSGISEPLGALVGYLILLPFMTPTVMGMIFSMVAGIMVYIAFDELLPAAREYGEHHISIYGLISGMAIMSFSLILF